MDDSKKDDNINNNNDNDNINNNNNDTTNTSTANDTNDNDDDGIEFVPVKDVVAVRPNETKSMDGTNKSVEFSLDKSVEISMDGSIQSAATGGNKSSRTSLLNRLRKNTSNSSLGSSSFRHRRSSFLQRMGQSFRRSGGARGASVETLRGTNGADFEGMAIITRGLDYDDCWSCCCFGKWSTANTDAVEKFLLIKGSYCFVFMDQVNDTCPKYAIPLAQLRAKLHVAHPEASPIHHGRQLVTLDTCLGDVQYEISFDNDAQAKLFQRTVQSHAAKAEADIVRKRLGHECLLVKQKSVVHANAVGQSKMNEQPEQHTREEAIHNRASAMATHYPEGAMMAM